MNISTLIQNLEQIKEDHGDLDVCIIDNKKGMIEIEYASVAHIVNIGEPTYKKVFIHI